MIPGHGGSLRLVECKTGRTVVPAMAVPMQRLGEAAGKHRGKGTAVDMTVVHQGSPAADGLRSVAPGVRALPWREFVQEL